jgi:Rieske Fe-S protein
MSEEQEVATYANPIADSQSGAGVNRRVLLSGAGAVGAVGLLAACGASAPEPSTKSSETAAGAASVEVPEKAVILASVSDVPEGGGYWAQDRELVITQPEPGEFRAFSQHCPHAGCAASEFANGEIVCPCHGSRFSADTGDVVQGPATTGLYAVEVEAIGDKIVTSVS